MTQRVSILNSNETLLVNDFDFLFIENRLLDNTWGVLFSNLSSKPEFDLNLSTWEVSSWEAIIHVTRTASQPIANEDFFLRYESSSTETVSIVANSKIYIEIDNTLLQDPTLIEDSSGSTTYGNWLSIWAITSSTTYPTHNNYIKLREIDATWSIKTDVRNTPQIDGDKVDMTDMTQNIKTGWTWEFGWQVTIPETPTADWHATSKKYVDEEIAITSGPYIFGDWSDWALVVASWTTNISMDTVYNYSSISISAWATLSTWAASWESMKLKCRWTATIDWTISTAEKQATSWITSELLWIEIDLPNVWAGWDGGNGWGKSGTFSWGSWGTWSWDWYWWWWWGWWGTYTLSASWHDWWNWGDGWTPGWTGWPSVEDDRWIAWWTSAWWSWWSIKIHEWYTWAGWDAYGNNWWNWNRISGTGAFGWWWWWWWDIWVSGANVMIYSLFFAWSWEILTRWWNGWAWWDGGNWDGIYSWWWWWGWWGSWWISWSQLIIWQNQIFWWTTNTPSSGWVGWAGWAGDGAGNWQDGYDWIWVSPNVTNILLKNLM